MIILPDNCLYKRVTRKLSKSHCLPSTIQLDVNVRMNIFTGNHYS